jgi:hypothetical protein
MTDCIHGLVSGLVWSGILGTFLIVIAGAMTVTVPARPRVRNTTAAANVWNLQPASSLPSGRLGRKRRLADQHREMAANQE